MKHLLGITLFGEAVALVVMVGVIVVARRNLGGFYWLYFDADNNLVMLSSDGNWLFYIHSENDQHWLYRMRIDGTDRQLVFGHAYHIAVPRSNSEGNRLLVGVSDDEMRGNYLIQTTFPFAIQKITDFTDDYLFQSGHLLHWGADGQWVVAGMTGYDCGGITTYDLRVPISYHIQVENLENYHDCLWLSGWSPDEQWVIFTTPTFRSNANAIFRSRPDGSDVQPIFVSDQIGASYSFVETWSPDGQWLVLCLRQSQDVCDLGRVQIDGSGLENLTNTPDIEERFQTWSPDGEWLIFRRDAFDGDAALYRMRVDGSDMEQITHVPGNEQFIAWSPHPTSLPWNPLHLLAGGILGVLGGVGVAFWWVRVA